MSINRLNFIFAVHNHQPVGNFDYVIERAYQRAYLPFLELLAEYPSVKVVLHYSGVLLRWIEKNHPECIDIIGHLVEEDRAEILSGGFYEPVVALIPENDAVQQIKNLSGYIEDLFNYRPRGMWLAERVWEPSMPALLHKAGIKYIPIDDYHFKRVGVSEEEMVSGYYFTEDKGKTVGVFPGSEKLRYYIPFKDLDVLSDFFRKAQEYNELPLLTFADDGEKFGIWPSTYKHCYEKGWLKNYFEYLEENSEWLETITFQKYYDSYYPVGNVYLPTASYREMGQWSLPERAAGEYEEVLKHLEQQDEETAKTWIGGGLWRGFFSKYPESNHLHKRMLMVSQKVSRVVRRDRSKAADMLYSSQCNDAFWHGIFGGLYLPHLRSALWENLINAESKADRLLHNGDSAVVDDIDCDGYQEVFMKRSGQYLVFSQVGGGLLEYSLSSYAINLTDVLERRKEHYHEDILKESERKGTDSTKTIHDRLEIKDKSVLDAMFFDDHRRSSFIEHFFEDSITLNDVIRSDYSEMGDFLGGLYDFDIIDSNKISAIRRGRAGDGRVEVGKTIVVKRHGMTVEYACDGSYKGLVGIEVNLSFRGSPLSEIIYGRKKKYAKDRGKTQALKAFKIVDNNAGLMVHFTFNRNIDLWHYPVETVSLSEEGAEKIFQGVCFLFLLRNINNLKINMKISGHDRKRSI